MFIGAKKEWNVLLEAVAISKEVNTFRDEAG